MQGRKLSGESWKFWAAVRMEIGKSRQKSGRVEQQKVKSSRSIEKSVLKSSENIKLINDIYETGWKWRRREREATK